MPTVPASLFLAPTPLLACAEVRLETPPGGGYSYGEDGESTAQQILTTGQITLISGEGTVNEKQESFPVPMRTPGKLTLVKSFSYP